MSLDTASLASDLSLVFLAAKGVCPACFCPDNYHRPGCPVVEGVSSPSRPPASILPNEKAPKG